MSIEQHIQAQEYCKLQLDEELFGDERREEKQYKNIMTETGWREVKALETYRYFNHNFFLHENGKDGFTITEEKTGRAIVSHKDDGKIFKAFKKKMDGYGEPTFRAAMSFYNKAQE